MPINHIIKQGECVSSLAVKYGFFPDTIWNHSANSSLRQLRESPNILFSGDVIVIPDKRLGEEDKTTDQRHRFRRRGVPEELRIRFLDKNDKPRSGLFYTLDIDGSLRKGRTRADGFLVEKIPANAHRGKLVLIDGKQQETIKINLGHLPPITEPQGIRMRLNNLGFPCGNENDEIGDKTRNAIKKFQLDQGLEVTGEPDKATIKKLETLHLS